MTQQKIAQKMFSSPRLDRLLVLGVSCALSGCADFAATTNQPVATPQSAVAQTSEPTDAAKAACRELIMRYALARDQRAADAFVALFTEDAVLVVNGDEVRGHDQLRARLAPNSAAPATLHIMSTIVIDRLSPNRARGQSYVSVYALDEAGAADGAGRLAAVGEYRDQFQLTASGWKIARREFVPRVLPPVK